MSFKDLMIRKETPAAAPRKVFTPAVDVRETPEALILWADLPGVDESGIEVSLEGNALTIEGRAAADAAPQGRTAVWREFLGGDWRRRFVLSLDAVNAEGIRADMKDGVLKVTIPKADQAKKRKISVTAA
jgi:HSP20 family protein